MLTPRKLADGSGTTDHAKPVREHFYDIEGDLWRSERKLSPSLDPNHILKFSEIKNIHAARPKK